MFRKNKLRKKALAICVASVLWTVPSISTANGLKSEMDALFNEMSNVTQPGVFETQRRGVLAGGRYTTKTRIFNENLVSFTPPSWKAGCGGVDLFGGSLSFVNAEQIVTLLRSVAANAKGYAFQLALDNVFPDGAKWIENFQKKIQQLNQYLGNSCELAQGLMDGNGASELIKNKATQIRTTTSGLFDDVFSATQEQGGPSATGQERDNNFDEYKKHIGNIVWKQLKKNNVNGWFTYGDTVLLESIMSLTGTVTIGDAVPDSHPTINNETNPVHYLPGNKIQLTDLINGLVNKDIYSCGSDTESCLTAGVAGSGLKKISLPGIKKQIEGMLLGSSSGVGMVNKFASNTGELSDIEKNFLANLPVGTGTIVRNLSVYQGIQQQYLLLSHLVLFR